MAQTRQRDLPATLRSRPLSADFATRTKEASMLYSLLPSAVKSRLPRLPSLRRSVSMYGLATRRKSADSRPPSGAQTPEYTSAMVLSGAGTLASEEDIAGYLVESLSTSSDEDVPQTSTGKGRQTSRMELTESRSGIGWKFANQGLNLLSLAVEESSTISQDARFGNASFARQVYLHAITYLLRALPNDMSTEEQLSIRGALPPGVVEPLRLDVNSRFNTHIISPPSDQPSILHRTLASTIVQLFILFQFVLPYLKYLLSAAYQYDREHKISEKLFSQGIETVDSLGKTGINFTTAIYGMGDGKVGQMITQTAAWFLEGVTGGIHEGIGEGMVIIGAAPRRSQRLERR
ncbi:hypothetical protein L207DRAFT_576408 [Hyaloscypha variabilis F]|uniref:Uncharacterized protein n=1 Tax=Hyaloscypha variabilis (strain UAMH 11265 / GT02V1 / F) TaxID=1149755 RepID=A0A2J6SA50_HYAVF|nr:hypothetical protein L207DRAFT_576408 [Hyaloscypha variabilis F]